MTDQQLEYIKGELRMLGAETALVNSLLDVSITLFVAVVALVGISSVICLCRMRQEYLKSRN
jgi:hypothetical protein